MRGLPPSLLSRTAAGMFPADDIADDDIAVATSAIVTRQLRSLPTAAKVSKAKGS